MTTASSAFYLLAMLYVVGPVLVAYIAIRVYRHVRLRSDQSVALPRPVNETTPRKSPFAFARTNGRKFTAWKLPVRWSRAPTGSSFQGKAASTASAKDLSIELLPTTALPPPPTLIPTSPPLVDLSALEASTGSRFSASLPPSPRRQALSLWQQLPSSPGHSLKGHRNIQHLAFPRPPSPHALLATTPPQSHKRSRSLGGVPVRRLSGGHSGLRNKLDVELLDLLPGHARQSSEEHLLIDFSSSSDDQIPKPKDDPASISPAASDIGVLPPSKVHNKVVEPRPMPLVDIIGEDSNVVSTQPKSEPDDDTAWMWFNSNAPSTIRSYDARVLAPQPQADPFLGERKFAFPLPLPFPKTEKLIDIPSEDACLELDSLDSSRTLVEVGSDLLVKEDYSSPLVPKVEVGVSETVVIDPFSDDYAVDYIPGLSQTRVEKGDQVQHDQDSPLVDVGDIECQVQNDQHPPSAYPPLIDVGDAHMGTSAATGLVLGDSQISSETDPAIPVVSFPIPSSSTNPSSQAEQTGWRWVEADDPWADHVTTQDETLAPNPSYGVVVDSQNVQVGNRLMETTPGGSLLATVLDADDEVPHLSLDDPNPAEELRLSHVVRGQLDDEDEEDATPRPTPVSIDIQLPASDDGNSLPDVARCSVLGNPLPIGHDDEQAVVNENFPDPDLLPLPEFNPPSSIIEVVGPSTDHSQDERLKFEPRPSSQMLTPPASPPSLSPTLLNQRKAGKSLPPSPMNGPKNLSVASDVTRGRSRSPRALQIALPANEPKEEHSDSIPVPSPAKSIEDLPSAKAEKYAEDLDEMKENEGTSLPGSLSEVSSTSPLQISSSKTAQTVAALLAEKSGPASFYPSIRAIVRQPVEIALAMQLRPGLGAGADPAWMVRFLMAMFGWFAVLVSGQENY